MANSSNPPKDEKSTVVPFQGHSPLRNDKESNTVSQETEETLRQFDAIIAHMPGYVYWKNANSEYMGCNDGLAKISKLKDRKDIIGKTDFDFDWGQEGAQKFQDDDKKVMEERVTHVSDDTLPIKRDDGHFIEVRTEKIPLFDSKNNVIGLLAIALDITDQKLTEETLRKQKEQIEKLSEAKTDFLRNMEHDIRTPFSGVYSLTKMLEETEEEPIRKEMLLAVEKCAKELLDYCNGILDYSKIESGSMPIQDKKFDLKHLIENIIVMEKPSAIEKKLELIFNYAKDMPTVYVGDKYRIQRILVNLVGNAIKFTHKGYVKISAKIGKIVDETTVVVVLSIEDTGIGIPKDKIDLIYEKFTRLNPSNKGEYKGVGLGLSIVKQLIADLGGEIEVNSLEEKGTSFICGIPLKKPLLDDLAFKDSDNE